jgi:hypothetical protein
MTGELTFRILFFTSFIAAMAIRAYFRWRVRRTGESRMERSHGHSISVERGKCRDQHQKDRIRYPRKR